MNPDEITCAQQAEIIEAGRADQLIRVPLNPRPLGIVSLNRHIAESHRGPWGDCLVSRCVEDKQRLKEESGYG